MRQWRGSVLERTRAKRERCCERESSAIIQRPLVKKKEKPEKKKSNYDGKKNLRGVSAK